MQMIMLNGGNLGKIEITSFLSGEVGYLHDKGPHTWVWRIHANVYGVPDGDSIFIKSPTVYETEEKAIAEMDKFVEQHLRTRLDE